jgi:hypothetical protein
VGVGALLLLLFRFFVLVGMIYRCNNNLSFGLKKGLESSRSSLGKYLIDGDSGSKRQKVTLLQ